MNGKERSKDFALIAGCVSRLGRSLNTEMMSHRIAQLWPEPCQFLWDSFRVAGWGS